MPLDVAALERAATPAFGLIDRTLVKASGVSAPVTGFSVFDRLYVVVQVLELVGERSPEVEITVEQSSDGNSWAAAAGPVTFTRDGSAVATIDSPLSRLRVSWAVSGGLRRCVIGSVSVTPGSLDAPGGGGGGGGLPFTGWTEDDSDPANVDANGGELRSTDGDGNHAELHPSGVNLSDGDGDEGYSMELGSGFTATPPADIPAFRVSDAIGGTVAFDGGGLPAKNLAEGTDPSDAATVSQLGGSIPSWWTVDSTADHETVDFAGVVSVSPPDNTVDDLFKVAIPAGYVDESNFGWIFRASFDLSTPNNYVFAVGLDTMHFHAAEGEGDGSFEVGAFDKSATATLGTGGLSLFGEDSAVYLAFTSNPTGAIGFFDKAGAPSTQQTGVAVTAAAIHAALVTYGLIAA